MLLVIFTLLPHLLSVDAISTKRPGHSEISLLEEPEPPTWPDNFTAVLLQTRGNALSLTELWFVENLL